MPDPGALAKHGGLVPSQKLDNVDSNSSQKLRTQFAVFVLNSVTWDLDAFDKLEIGQWRLRLVHSLVKSPRQDEPAFDGIDENKGRGLLGLLTGNPGVGKRSATEAVAEVARRPIYMVTTGELGIEPDKMDRQLEMMLDISRC
ncbi:hypothetical protein MMC25_007649 [Agyrium rufum]|nr:hypothetical protein [Agyrium rufum]